MADDAVMQPVGDVLRADPAGGAVFHEAHVVDVGHLGAADALIDPADDIAEDALGVVLDLLDDLFVGPLAIAGGGDVEQRVDEGAAAAGLELILHGEDVDHVVMEGVQRGGGGRGHPGAVGTGFGVLDLLFHHCGHLVGHGPHALADLGLAGKAAFEADIDILVLVAADPGLALDEILAAEGAGFHAGVDLVAGAVEEAGIDEGNAVLGGADAFLEVDGSAAFLVHHADLDGVLRQAEEGFDAGEDFVGEGDLVGAVHLGFDDVDRAVHGVAAVAGEVVHADERGDRGIHQALGDLVAVGIEDGGVGHQVADVADPHQRAALEGERAAVGGGETAVFGEAAGEGLAALVERGFQRALHQAQPVGIGEHLVLGIDAGDGILAIHDGRDGAFDADIGQQRLIAAADEMGAVEDQLDMQAVVAQQDRVGRFGVAAVAGEFRGVGEGAVVDQQGAVLHVVAPDIGVTGAVEGEEAVEEDAGAGDDPGAAAAVVTARGRGRAHGVGAVERVVEAAPAGVGSVERVARVGDGHDELGARHEGDLGVDVGGFDLEIGAVLDEVADLGEELLVGLVIVRLVAVADVPLVDLALQLVAPVEEGLVLRGEVGDEGGEAGPEVIGRDAGAGQGALLDEPGQLGGHLQAMLFDTFLHVALLRLSSARAYNGMQMP